MTYEQNELKAYQWFVENYDTDAQYLGGSDSTVSDIYSPKYDCYIEVKMIDKHHSARCGQFVEGVVSENPYVEPLYNNETSQENLEGFVRYHYKEKGVEYFIVGIDEYFLLTFDEFIAQTTLVLAKPYKKRSGTRSCGKKISKELLAIYSDFVIKNDKLYCISVDRYNEMFEYNGKQYFISEKNAGEVRVRGKAPEKLTYHVEVKLK